MDTARSRNIVKADTFDDPNPENTDYRAICVEVEFTPEVSMTTVDQGLAGISPALQFSLLNQSSSIPEAIEYYCDSDDYNALMMLGPDMTFAVAQSVWFSK